LPKKEKADMAEMKKRSRAVARGFMGATRKHYGKARSGFDSLNFATRACKRRATGMRILLARVSYLE
jgi:hypothetical protein